MQLFDLLRTVDMRTGWLMQDLNCAIGRKAVRGFTAQDWTQLEHADRSGAVSRRWGHAEIATNDFSQYLALWYEPPAGREPPNLAVVRFDETGAYALLSGEAFFVATSLAPGDPAGPVGGAPSGPRTTWTSSTRED